MKNNFQKLSSKIDGISRSVIIFLFALAFICTVYQVFSRFVLQSSVTKELLPFIDFSIFNFTWIEELIRYLFVWIVFLGIGTVYKHNGHAKVEILINVLSEKWKNRLLSLIEVINVGLFIFLSIFGLRILKFTTLQISPSLGLNMTFVYVAVLLSSLICMVHSFARLFEILSKADTRIPLNNVEVIPENTNMG
ncbi:TRAP transporter small permease [Mesobacillus subterraneus]|uniref:TRAP transporter small permease n=1 Tax=Mesobacillus subterraneus TaxID=285983 RepID=UPI00203F215A|nr:TRAP transporter small permease [Mesobacillus subterraneus]MCM3665056.1 TRAP transporter small permease [Mesobacillus subterraneus]MCM3684071.1 TRAP transporter small permease [Mesobacillus subterraneus]